MVFYVASGAELLTSKYKLRSKVKRNIFIIQEPANMIFKSRSNIHLVDNCLCQRIIQGLLVITKLVFANYISV